MTLKKHSESIHYLHLELPFEKPYIINKLTAIVILEIMNNEYVEYVRA